MPANIRASTKTESASTQTCTVNVPTHQSGDELVLIVMADNIGTLTPDESGWTQLVNAPGTPWQTVQGAWHRTAGGSEPASYSVTSTGSAGNMLGVMVACDPDGDTLDAVTASALAASAATDTGTTNSLTGAADNTIALAAFVSDDDRTVATPPGTMTQVQLANGTASELAVYREYNVGASAFQRTLVWNSSTDVAQFAVLLAYTPGVAGPTITDQPDNATVLLSEGSSASFTVAATGTDLQGVTWNVDGSPVADGGIYDIVTVIDPGGASGTSTLTVTPIATTGSPFDVDADVTDDNGTTASATATLTVLAGDALSAAGGTTDGSGEAVTQYTTDASAAAGTVARVQAVSGGVTKTLAMRPGG